MIKWVCVIIALIFLYNTLPLAFYGLLIVTLGIIIKYVLNAFPLRFPRFHLEPDKLDIFFGAPGSGKTTLAAYFAAKAMASGIPVYSNVPIVGCYLLDKSDIGVWNIENALVIFDEAGVDFNSRNFKSNFTLEQIKWYKYHRHEGCQVMIFSQGFDDMDKILRTLSTRLWVVRKSALRTIVYRAIKKQPDIDELAHQPIDYYDWQPFSRHWIYSPAVWKYFDSWTRLGLPDKPVWAKWGSPTPQKEEP